MTIVRDILVRAIKLAMNVPQDRIQSDVMRFALDSYNHYGQLVWNQWKWDNAKLTDKAYTPDADGIIELDADVETVRAVYTGTDDTTKEPVSNFESTLKAGGSAPALTNATFEYLADNDSGQRRIKVSNADATYTVLALKRFVEATIEGGYDSEDPTATPTDYRVLKWTLDRAKPAIVAYISDQIRAMQGKQSGDQGSSALASAIEREESFQAKDHRVVPSHPGYSDIGNWH